MGGFLTLIFVYIAGGLTFIPLVLGLFFLYGYYTFPRRDDASPSRTTGADDIHDAADDGKNILSGASIIASRLQSEREKDVAEGYFAVCREYVPGGINGKPPVRTTPAGEVIAQESPSVYQNMYRSLFERRQGSSLDATKTDGAKAAKRARNMFYVVLRHGHLMLYDDSEQVEVRHVISLAHHDVSIYGGGNEIPEGELWIKRNAICLRRKASSLDKGASTLPFFFFSENCSEKEDFYFALVRSQDKSSHKEAPPQVQDFELKDIISLVQRLHSSEEHLQTRWLNALVGRLFLAVYKTQTAEDFIRMKITKKIARVKKPAFLSGIVLKKIDMGHSAPLVTNPKLRDLTVEGEYCAEVHVSYEGGFRIEIAATARLDLGPRFKAREVDLVLAVLVKKLEGKLLIRMKPPPSNRIWISFETMPHLELSIEPIVSSRQITYSIILRAIESRIREVLAETLVLPHWDDSPFLDTVKQAFRGGIWEQDGKSSKDRHETTIPDDTAEDEAETGSLNGESPHIRPVPDDRSMSTPVLPETGRSIFRRGHKSSSSHSLTADQDTSVSTGVQKVSEVPKVLRSHSFASAADPVVNTSSVNSNAGKKEHKKGKPSKDAASIMSEISNRSQPSSPVNTPTGPRPALSADRDKSGSFSSASSVFDGSEDGLSASQSTIQSLESSANVPRQGTLILNSANTTPLTSHQQTKLQAMAKSLAPSEKRQQAMLSAAAAAKNWGWNTFNRNRKGPGGSAMPEKAGTPDNPLGRGRPLPPPGQPLPLPEEKQRSMISLSIPKRKPIPTSPKLDDESPRRTPAVTPRERRRENSLPLPEQDGGQLLVVAAPAESEPNSPVEDDTDGYGEFMDNVNPEDEEELPDHAMLHETPPEGTPPGGTPPAGTPPETAEHVDIVPEPRSHRSHSSTLSSSYEDDENHGLASWRIAQEEEARSKSVWMDDQEQ